MQNFLSESDHQRRASLYNRWWNRTVPYLYVLPSQGTYWRSTVFPVAGSYRKECEKNGIQLFVTGTGICSADILSSTLMPDKNRYVSNVSNELSLLPADKTYLFFFIFLFFSPVRFPLSSGLFSPV